MGKIPLPLLLLHAVAMLLITYAAITTHKPLLWVLLFLYAVWVAYKLFKPGA